MEQWEASSLTGGRPRLQRIDRPMLIAMCELACAYHENVALFDLKAAALFRRFNVLRHHTLATLDPIDAPDHGDIHQHPAGHDAILRHLNRLHRCPEAGGDQVGGTAVIHLTVP